MKITAKFLLLVAACCSFNACSTPPASPLPPLTWSANDVAYDPEYAAFAIEGSGEISGQAFLTQRNGGVVHAAGREVTLDPATSLGNEWWAKSGRVWVRRFELPPSPLFTKARKKTIADADGRFRFSKLPPGKYYVRTEVTWDVVYMGAQGGALGRLVEVKPAESVEIILNEITR